MPTYQIDDSKVESDLVFLEELRFVLHGKISRHDAPLFTSNTAYLFIPPLTPTWIKGISSQSTWSGSVQGTDFLNYNWKPGLGHIGGKDNTRR
ncbi:hypothetical protein PQX77_009614 [Marasmius sp. AFHP31]|nr:hypothetical protein PQX77_009614 [Marasmius sp. AFHP31]